MQMRALGIHSRLDQVFDAPVAVKEVLIGQFGLEYSVTLLRYEFTLFSFKDLVYWCIFGNKLIKVIITVGFLTNICILLSTLVPRRLIKELMRSKDWEFLIFGHQKIIIDGLNLDMVVIFQPLWNLWLIRSSFCAVCFCKPLLELDQSLE